MPRFQNVKVAGLALEKKSTDESAKKGSSKSAIIGLVTFLALAALGALGYFAYSMFLAAPAPSGTGALSGTASNNSLTPTPAATITPLGSLGSLTGNAPANGAQTNGTGSTPAGSATGSFTHASLFAKQPADQVFTLTLASAGTGATSAADLATFNQKLSTLLSSASVSKKTPALLEVVVKNGGGNDMSISDILSAANENVIDPSVLNADFDPDATFFVYHDANGFWPGYVMAPKPAVSPSSIQSQVAKLESSPGISNFFLNNPGAPSSDGFTDAAVGSTAVRVLPFLNATPLAYFAYGWSGNDLILSTSMNGFAAATSRL